MSKICDSRDFQSEKQKYHLAYKMNCSGEIFNSKWPWCVQLIYDQGPQISRLSGSLQSHRCCTLHKNSAVKNAKHHRNAQWVRQKCPGFGPAPTMEEGSSFGTSPDQALCTGSLRNGWAIFLGKTSPPLTAPGSNKQRGLVLCLDFASHYPTLHSEQMWRSFLVFGTLLHPDQIENTAQHQKIAQIHQSAISSYPLTYWFNLEGIPDLLLRNPGLNSQLRHPFLA